jgi:hypothetical protein
MQWRKPQDTAAAAHPHGGTLEADSGTWRERRVAGVRRAAAGAAVASMPAAAGADAAAAGTLPDDVAYQRMMALPQVKPLPNPVRTSRSPRFRRPAWTHSSMAMGMVAAVVLPKRSMLL